MDPRWKELEIQASAILRAPEYHPKSAGIGTRHFIIQFRHQAAFGLWRSWTVYSPWKNQDDQALVRRVIWEHAKDGNAMSDPQQVARRLGSSEPTIEVSDAALPWRRVESWRGELASIRVPLVQGKAVGSDGESFGLRYGDHFLGVDFQWWGDGSEEWRELIHFFDRALSEIEDLYAAR